jgi:hypothetical protein
LTEERTTLILELLRRPEIDCEPVTVGGRQFVWNRFRDITYVGNAALLRLWVERREPFKTTGLDLPKTASDLIGAKKRPKLHVHVAHSPDVCPLHPSSETEIETVRERHGSTTSEGLRVIEGPLDQPDSLLNESIYRHGQCWKVRFETEGMLPPSVARLQDVQLSGPALASLLRTGALTYPIGTQWVVQEFEAPDAGNLAREFRESVHLVEAYRSIIPNAKMEPIMPGTSLMKIEETWTLGAQVVPGWAGWSAISDLTGKYYGKITNEIQLDPRTPIKVAERIILDEIMKRIPRSKIHNFAELGPMIRRKLKDARYPGAARQQETIHKAVTTQAGFDYVKVNMDYTKMRTEATELVEHGRYDEALEVMDRNISLLEHFNAEATVGGFLLDVLISKFELLASGKMEWTPDPSLLLRVSDRVKELASRLEGRVLQSRSELAQRVNWVLSIHESLKKSVNPNRASPTAESIG